MKYVKFYVSMGYVGGDAEEVMEYPDDTADEKINEDYDMWQSEQLSGCWVPCDKNGNELE